MLARLSHSSLDLPGSGMPFYTSEDYIPQLRRDMLTKPSTWICPPEELIPFQVVWGIAAVTGFALVSPDDGTVVSLSTGDISSTSISGSRKLHSFDGAGSASEGRWYYRLTFFGGATIESDIFSVDECKADDSMQLVWWDTKEFCGGVYYGGGYKNKMWLHTQFARPRVDYTEILKTNGRGYPYPVHQRTEDVYVVDALTCDSQMSVLYRVANHNQVQITYPRGTELFDVHTFRANDTGDKKDALAYTELTFKREYMENTTFSFAL